MSEENVANFVAITGAPADQASMFLEMAGGDMETAVSIFFSNMDTGDGAGAGAGPGADEDAEMAAALAMSTGGQAEAPPWWGVVWPERAAIPEAWREQRLDCQGGWAGGIPQPKNGPCGVLAVVHALILVEQHRRDPLEIQVTPDATAAAIHGILLRCRPEEGAPVRLVRSKQRGAHGPDAELEETALADPAAALAEIQARVEEFRGPGGIVDLVHSAVMTRGAERVKAEAESEGGEVPIVTKAFSCWLCSMELLSLILRGSARGNVGAFNADGSPNRSWDGVPVGILSRSEKETGIPMSDALKGPPNPVWILHGGDHFTVAWAKAAPQMDAGASFALHHWNGLPPGGPRLTQLSVTAIQGTTAGPKEKPKFFKPEPGEVDELVQADTADKQAYPDQYRKWRYEVLLAWDNPDVQGEVRPPGVPAEPKLDQEDARFQRPGAWRCRLCYERRFQTMDFSLVPEDSPDSCPKCQKPRKDCGWSLWVPFAELPEKFQGQVMDRHAKKIEPILWTRWPAAEITSSDGSLPDC